MCLSPITPFSIRRSRKTVEEEKKERQQSRSVAGRNVVLHPSMEDDTVCCRPAASSRGLDHRRSRWAEEVDDLVDAGDVDITISLFNFVSSTVHSRYLRGYLHYWTCTKFTSIGELKILALNSRMQCVMLVTALFSPQMVIISYLLYSYVLFRWIRLLS